MNIKEIFQQAGTAVGEMILFVGWLIWSLIKGIATVITFFIIFGLLFVLLPFQAVGFLSLILLLWFVYTYRHRVATVIGVLIACSLALMLFSSVKYYLLPNWVVIKSSSFFKTYTMNKGFGMSSFKGETLDQLTCYGNATLDNVLIKGPLTVFGQLSGDKLGVLGTVTTYGEAELSDAKLSDLIVFGDLNLDNGLVSGKTTIYGKAHIEKSQLDDLIVFAKKIKVSSSTVKNIYMKKDEKKAKVTLIGTTVSGDVVFEKGDGKVVLSGDSKILGKIVGGSV